MAGVPSHIALTSEVSEISFSELKQVANALQLQLVRDLNPAWSHALGTVTAYSDPNNLPMNSWPIYIQEDIGEPGALGYHTDANGQPYSLIAYDSTWTVTASHELLEMVADPWGSRLYVAPSPDQGLEHVRILLELCDPCEQYDYEIDGVRVSDFILHQYGNGKTGPFDFLREIRHARQVLDGGYISWVERDGTWKQLTNFGGPEVTILGMKDPNDKRSPREWIAAQTGDND